MRLYFYPKLVYNLHDYISFSSTTPANYGTKKTLHRSVRIHGYKHLLVISCSQNLDSFIVLVMRFFLYRRSILIR
ncbi:Spo0E family sporulation regulatory protein-aspartic acid phosphatase [Bacillus cereus group sp. N6]|nr:Spo0E family sporulation regulatory protein-aspartic acid phosphatase [Bacillus cereus group sp. N6]